MEIVDQDNSHNSSDDDTTPEEGVKKILLGVLNHGRDDLERMIELVQNTEGPLDSLPVSFAQSTYKICEKLGFGLGVLLPRNHQKVLENIFQKVLERVKNFQEEFGFEKVLVNKGCPNKLLRQKISKIKEEKKKIKEEKQKIEEEKNQIEEESKRIARELALAQDCISKMKQAETQEREETLRAQQLME